MHPYITVPRAFLNEAATFALQSQDNLEVSFKDTERKDFLTNIDLAISQKAHEALGVFLKQGDILIDEEKLPAGTPAEIFATGKPLWILDPIDGTRPFASKNDPSADVDSTSFGVMLALLVDGKFTYAGINMPARNLKLELAQGKAVVTAGEGAAQSSRPIATELPFTQESIAHIGHSTKALQPLLEAHAGLTCKLIPSAAEMTLSLAMGTIALMALPQKAGFWDVAPAMAIAQLNGYVAYFAKKPGQQVVCGPEMFRNDWKLMDDLVITSREVYNRLYPARAA